MAFSINVAPAEDGWAVDSSALEGPLLFQSGGKAEAAARLLAEQLARSGQVAEIVIVLRDGSIAGRIPFPATCPERGMSAEGLLAARRNARDSIFPLDWPTIAVAIGVYGGWILVTAAHGAIPKGLLPIVGDC